MRASVLDDVRAAAARVAASAHFVHVNTAAIESYAAGLPLAQVRAPTLDRATHYLGEPAATLAYFLTLDAINFGSGYFPRVRKRPGMSGYFTVASSLKDVWDRAGPLSPAQLAALAPMDCMRIFGQAPGDPAVDELMALFSRALQDLGSYVLEAFEGRFELLVAAADGSAEQLVGVLARMPLYQDVSHYAGREVPFYKRAQLTAADLQLAGVAEFTDLARLTIFADNLVSHVLRLDGILEYTPDLLARIEGEELIPAGSPEEVEIRACAIHAVELMTRVAQVSAMQLDYLLWNRGQEANYKAVPRHRSRGFYY